VYVPGKTKGKRYLRGVSRAEPGRVGSKEHAGAICNAPFALKDYVWVPFNFRADTALAVWGWGLARGIRHWPGRMGAAVRLRPLAAYGANFRPQYFYGVILSKSN
jgi:hypothetical protein